MSGLVNLVRSFLGYLQKKWWLLLLIGLTGAGLGAIYYYRQKPKYEAVTTFILEDKSAGGNGLSGLASQFGFNMGGLDGGSIFSGDNILDILRSKKIVGKVLLSPVDSATNAKSLADLYVEFTGLKRRWEEKSGLVGINFSSQKATLSPKADSLLNGIYDQLIKDNISIDRYNKKGSIIKVQVTAANDLFARLMSERLVDEAGKLYLDIRIGTSQENIRQMQRRSDSLLVLLNRKSFAAAAGQPLDLNPAMRTAVVPVEIANRDKTVLATLYAEIIKNLEASKLLLSQQTPVIQLLDKPGYLLTDRRKGLLFLMVVACVAAALLYIGTAFLLFLLRGTASQPVDASVRVYQKEKRKEIES